VAALGLAILPSALYADGLATAKTEQIRELIERERLVRARRELTALRELGTDRTIGSETPMNLAKRLDTQIRQYEKAVSWPLPANATIEHKLQRALMLIPLDRLDEAATLLKPLAASGEFPAMLLATVYQEQERWAESDEWFARGLSGSPATVATALDGLIFNARESRRPADVEQWLRRGLELFPDRAAEFHYKLGQHYAHAGKPNRAVTAFTAAAAADPKRYAELARTQMDQLRTGTPACLLRLPPGGLSASVP
jgi:tetratricopeptide (TPR) repeat protein